MARIPRTRPGKVSTTSTSRPSQATSRNRRSNGNNSQPQDTVELSPESRSKGKKKDSGGWVPGWVHSALDVAGMVPVIGNAADVVNAGLYASEGDVVNAGISLAGAIPGGQAATGARLAVKAGGAAIEATGKAAAKKTAKEGAQSAAQKAGKGTGGPQGPKRSKKPQTEELVRDHKNFETARNKALDEIGSLNHDFKPVKGKFGAAKGKVNGQQSADGKRGFRLDYDPEKGPHVNWYDWSGGRKGQGGRWGAEQFPGTEKDLSKLLKQFDK